MKYILICTLSFLSCVPMDHSQRGIGDAMRKVTPKDHVHCMEETWYGLKMQPAIHINCGHK